LGREEGEANGKVKTLNREGRKDREGNHRRKKERKKEIIVSEEQ
jgi:hypothetical protein